MKLMPSETLRKKQCRRRIPWVWIAPVLCLLFALGCAGYAYLTVPRETQTQQTKTVYTFEQLVPEDAGTPTGVTLSQNGESYALIAEDDGYALEGESLQIDSDKAKTLLACGASILSRDSVQGNAEDFGLGEDALTAVFTYEDGQTLTLILGNAPATGEGRYAQVEGDETIYVVNQSLYDSLSAGKYALAAVPDLSEVFTAQTLMEVTISRPDKETITIRRVTEDNPFNSVAEFTAPISYPANSERTAELFLALAEIEPSYVLDSTDDDAAYGLDDPLAEIDLTGSSGKTVHLTLGSTAETLTLRIDGKAEVYALDSSMDDFLQTCTVAYLVEQLPGLVALSEVDEVVLTRGSEVRTMRIDRTGDETVYTVDDVNVEEETFLSLYQTMIGLLIDQYPSKPLETAPVRASFEYHLTDGTVWTLAFAEYDASYDAVVRDGEADFLIARSKVDAVFDALGQ